MLVSLGFPDGEEIGRVEFLSVVRRITAALSVPLTVDSLAAFGPTPKDARVFARGLIKAGAIGLNVEDYDHGSGKLVPLERQIGKIRAVIEVAQSSRVPLVLNARTDALRLPGGSDEEKFMEAVSRARAYRDAGVDCVYPMGLADPTGISRFVKELDNFPVNVMVRKELPDIRGLESLGVARVSFGPYASYAALGLLKRASKEILERGTFDLLTDDGISYGELNSLAQKKRREKRA